MNALVYDDIEAFRSEKVKAAGNEKWKNYLGFFLLKYSKFWNIPKLGI